MSEKAMKQDYTDLVKRLRFRMNLDDPQLAADAIEAQAARIEALEAEVQTQTLRVWALLNKLPDETLCGEIQDAYKKWAVMPDRIAELEAALRPFAAAADLYTDETMWSHPVKEYLDRFRSARAALNTKGE